MPQMVALFNGVGGGAAALIAARGVPPAGAARRPARRPTPRRDHVLGAHRRRSASAGSLVAFGKLQELVPGKPIIFPGQNVDQRRARAGPGRCAIALTAITEQGLWLVLRAGRRACCFGVLFVLPIGGADMPVVISLLNAFTGLAAASTGFVLDNNGADHRRHARRRLGHAADADDGPGDEPARSRTCSSAPSARRRRAGGRGGRGERRTAACASASPDDVAVMLAYARRVIFVPGYGLAVAQAQHDVRELADLLEEKGVDVKLRDPPRRRADARAHERAPRRGERALRRSSSRWSRSTRSSRSTDVVLVVGANDVVNPAARNEPGSPIYGMPILDVDKADRRRRAQAEHEPRLRRGRQPALLRPEHGDALRRREGGTREADRRRSSPSEPRPGPALRSPRRRGRSLAGARGRGRPRRIRRLRARRVVDAAEGLRARVSGRRLPRHACARSRPRAAEVGDLVSGQPGAGACRP